MKLTHGTAYTLSDFVARFGGEVVGDVNTSVSQVASLDSASADQISFYSGARYRQQLLNTDAGAIILGPKDREATNLPRIVCDNAYAYFAKVSTLLNPEIEPEPGIHALAAVEDSASIAPSASIGAFVYIGKNVNIGEQVNIASGCHVGDNVVIGDAARLHPRVVVYHDCVIGQRVILHSGVVIGADGFGLANEDGRWIKIPQIGRVVIGDDVEIGANTTVDRGAMEDTIIEEGVKLDNLIMVAHNVHIGAHSAMAGCVGVAGSTTIGAFCTIGGGAIVLGHLVLADRVHISAASVVTRSLHQSGHYTGIFPIDDNARWEKNAASLKRLHQLRARLSALEKSHKS